MFKKFILDFAVWLIKWLRDNVGFAPQVINRSARTHHENEGIQPEDIEPVDTSFFCTKQFAPDIIEKNIRQAIYLASSKADACRRIMALETYGYILLSNVSDDRKAELINQFAASKYTFTPDDFINARRRKK